MPEFITQLAKVLPQLAIIAAVFGIIGWWLRGSSAKPEPAKSTKSAASDKAPQDRSKNLESALEKSKAAHKALKSELDGLKAGSIPKADHEMRLAELEAAHSSLATESKRTAVLEVELRKAQETLKTLNARSNEVSKAQKDRSFTLENELSKVRRELALLQDRPDDTATLQAEIERLRESVATSTRFAGELRKREATTLEALERAQAQLANAGDAARPAASRKIGPVGDGTRVAAAKAEVLRLIERNKQNSTEVSPAIVESPTVELPTSPIEPAAIVETSEPEDEDVAAPAEKRPPVQGELVALEGSPSGH